MTTSGVNILKRSAAEIVTSALRRARIIAVRQPISSIDLETGIDALNNMIAELRAQGWHLWKSEEYALLLEQGKTDYRLGPTGDRAVFLDDLIEDVLTVAAIPTDTQLTISDTSKFTGSDNVLSFDPSTSTSGWTSSNAAVSSNGTSLNILNSLANGHAQYEAITTTAKENYFFQVEIVANVGNVTLEVYSGLSLTLLASELVTVDGVQTINFVATEESAILRIVNDSATGDTDVVDFKLRETDTGESIGFRVNASLREWNIVTRVLSSTELEVKNLVVNNGAINASILAYKNLAPRPLKLRNYRSRTSVVKDEIPMNTWSRSQYMRQTIKNSQGLPTQAYYDPQLDNGRLYVWQVASDVNQMVLFTSDTPLEIMVENSNDPDFPAEWFNMLSWGLASEIGPEYGIPAQRQQIIDQKAGLSKDTASGWDEESGSLLIGPTNNGRP